MKDVVAFHPWQYDSSIRFVSTDGWPVKCLETMLRVVECAPEGKVVAVIHDADWRVPPENFSCVVYGKMCLFADALVEFVKLPNAFVNHVVGLWEQQLREQPKPRVDEQERLAIIKTAVAEHRRVNPTMRTCNRHVDCDAADAKARQNGSARAGHCHDDCCEDCFGQ